MIDRKLTISFQDGTHPARIDRTVDWTWPEFAEWLTTPGPVVEDKASIGWYIPVAFSPAYRDSDNFVARHAITFDFDHVPTDTWTTAQQVWKELAWAGYGTWSHTTEKPRFRIVMPLSRPATYDEFQAVARKVATDIGIELIARESLVPSQMMFKPARKVGAAEFIPHINEGAFLDVDGVLAEYPDWTDHKSWPHRQDGDGVHAIKAEQTPPTEKPGVVGAWCRAFSVEEAISRFKLPYERNS